MPYGERWPDWFGVVLWLHLDIRAIVLLAVERNTTAPDFVGHADGSRHAFALGVCGGRG